VAAFEVFWVIGQDGFYHAVLPFNQDGTSKDRSGDVPDAELAPIPDVMAKARGDAIACSYVLIKGGDGNCMYTIVITVRMVL